MKSWLQHLALLLLCCAGAATHAGRPLQTEDAGVLEAKACELEAVYERARASGAAAISRSLQVGCGIGWQTQVALAAARAQTLGERAERYAINGKTALLAPKDDAAAITLAWSLDTHRGAGSGLRHESSALNLVLTQPQGDWLMHANLGWNHSRSARQSTTAYSVAVERTRLGAFDLMAELFADDRSEATLNFGLRFGALPERLWLDASWGRQLASPRAKLVSVGLKLAF